MILKGYFCSVEFPRIFLNVAYILLFTVVKIKVKSQDQRQVFFLGGGGKGMGIKVKFKVKIACSQESRSRLRLNSVKMPRFETYIDFLQKQLQIS